MSTARGRWAILAAALLKKTEEPTTPDPALSVRRFASFGLFLVHPAASPAHLAENAALAWQNYTLATSCPPPPPAPCTSQQPTPMPPTPLPTTLPDLTVALLQSKPSAQELMGFNNTGNICVWVAEEVLSYYVLHHRIRFQDKVVCEVGSGMTALAGLIVAQCTHAKEVYLNDGNPGSVQNINTCISANQAKFSTTVHVHPAFVLQWNRHDPLEELHEKMDTIICADCLFFQDVHQDLIHVLARMLKEEGEIIMFAPTRGDSLDNFVKLAAEHFDVEKQERYDEYIWQRRQQELATNTDFDVNLHYPLLLVLRKHSNTTQGS
eukprot:m.202274 g.202274  ORF g.202274 m.202274 type:complete len:322 (+) comp25981_c0_seq3:6587-7552(+)